MLCWEQRSTYDWSTSELPPGTRKSRCFSWHRYRHRLTVYYCIFGKGTEIWEEKLRFPSKLSKRHDSFAHINVAGRSANREVLLKHQKQRSGWVKTTVCFLKAKANNCFKLTVMGLSLIRRLCTRPKQEQLVTRACLSLTVMMHGNASAQCERCKNKCQKGFWLKNNNLKNRRKWFFGQRSIFCSGCLQMNAECVGWHTICVRFISETTASGPRVCLEHQMARSQQKEKGLSPFSTAPVLKGYKHSPGPRTQPSQESSSGLEALRARCVGPTERLLTPSERIPRAPPPQWGSTNWPQTPRGLGEGGRKKRGGKLGSSMHSDGSVPGANVGNPFL